MECLVRKLPKVNLIVRCKNVHTSNILSGWRQNGLAMKKVMGAPRKKKLYFEESPKMPSPDGFSKGAVQSKQSGNPKRVTVLNKLFMRHITDQLGSGKCAAEILGHGVEINRVKITTDFKILKVYWLAKGTDNDEVIEKILQRNSGVLRHELSQLRLMGAVPIIQFVKDKHYTHIAELDSRLSIADFGEDHTPLDPAEKLRTEFEILSPLNDSIKEKLMELDKMDAGDSEELPLPPMPQNVLGLNHADILERIKKSKKKSEAPHRNNPSMSGTEESWVTFKVSQSINENPIQLGDNHTQRAALKEFLHKRQLLRMKAKQGNKNYIPDLEYIREELAKRRLEDLSKFDIPEIIEEDYIDEDLDNNSK